MSRITKKHYMANAFRIRHKEAWQNLNTIGMVQRERHVGDDIGMETSYHISSIENNAERFGHAVRSHWGIENSLHWVLDVSFREDKSRIRKDNTPQTSQYSAYGP